MSNATLLPADAAQSLALAGAIHPSTAGTRPVEIAPAPRQRADT